MLIVSCIHRILRPWQNSEPRSITNTTLCTKCGGAGHISSDCKYSRWRCAECPNLSWTPDSTRLNCVTTCASFTARSLHTEQLVESPLSQLKTRLVWTRSICLSWLSWGRPLSQRQPEDTPAPRAHLGLQAPTAPNLHRLVGTHVVLCTRRVELCLKFSVCSTEPASVDEFWSSREQELSRHAWGARGARWSWRTSQFSSSDAQHGRTAYASQPQWLASTLDAAPSSSHGPGTWTAWTPDG